MLDQVIQSYVTSYLFPLLRNTTPNPSIYVIPFNPKYDQNTQIEVEFYDQLNPTVKYQELHEVYLFRLNIKYLTQILLKLINSKDKLSTARESLQFILDNYEIKYNIIIDNQRIKPPKYNLHYWFFNEKIIKINNKSYTLVDILDNYILASLTNKGLRRLYQLSKNN